MKIYRDTDTEDERFVPQHITFVTAYKNMQHVEELIQQAYEISINCFKHVRNASIAEYIKLNMLLNGYKMQDDYEKIAAMKARVDKVFSRLQGECKESLLHEIAEVLFKNGEQE